MIFPNELRGLVVGNLVSCSGGPAFKSRPSSRYRDWGFSWVLSVSPGKFRDSTFRTFGVGEAVVIGKRVQCNNNQRDVRKKHFWYVSLSTFPVLISCLNVTALFRAGILTSGTLRPWIWVPLLALIFAREFLCCVIPFGWSPGVGLITHIRRNTKCPNGFIISFLCFRKNLWS